LEDGVSCLFTQDSVRLLRDIQVDGAMKAGILEAIGRLVVRDVPDPVLEEGSVLLRVKACNICGTDLRVYHHGHPRIRLPQVLGHEAAGEIATVAGDVAGYRAGERIAVTPRIACGACFYCLRGQYNYCESSRTFGYQLSGGYAEYMMIPSRGVEFGVLNRVADSLSFEEAGLAEPLSCCQRAQRASRVEAGCTVVVIGGGPVGIMHCRLARSNGAGKVILVEKDVNRLEKIDLSTVDHLVNSARSDPEIEIERFTAGRGADVVIIACSSLEMLEQSFALAGKGGRINFFAGLPHGQSSITVDANLVHYSEIAVHGSHGSNPQDNREALDLLASRVVLVDDLLTDAFNLESIEEAFVFAGSNKGMKVTIHP